MTYDFNGSWEPNAGHNSPLFPPERGDSSRSVDSAFRLYHAFYGIPSQKIGLGIPFYGHTFTKCSAIGDPQAGSDTSHFAAWGARYIDIAGAMNHFERHWDTLAQVPYLVSKEWNMLVSYDDQASVRAKADYAVEKRVGGIIIWEITGDYMPDGSHPLLDAVHTGLRKPSPIHH
jgi:chitinase